MDEGGTTLNVRKLMARLNPPIKVVRPSQMLGNGPRAPAGSPSLRRALEVAGKYQAGELTAAGTGFTRTGGSETRSRNPEALSAIDIAHALGHVQDRFARELFCHLWWPDGAARTRADLEREIHLMLIVEYGNRCRDEVEARLALHLVECSAVQWRPDDRIELRKCRQRMERARARAWPGKLSVYPQIVSAVLDELAAPNHCAMCEGRGTVWAGDIARDCGACDGTGTIPVSDRQRADALKKEWKTYRDSWCKPYAWLYRECWAKEGFAAKDMRRALGEAPGRAAA